MLPRWAGGTARQQLLLLLYRERERVRSHIYLLSTKEHTIGYACVPGHPQKNC